MSETTSSKKLAAFLLPIPGLIPIFYLQGIATYEGGLAPYGISPGLYPIGIESALTFAFFSYTKALPAISLAMLLSFLLVPISALFSSSWMKKVTNATVPSSLSLLSNRVDQFLDRFKGALLPGFILFSLVYLIVALFFCVYIPYSSAKSDATTKFREQAELLSSAESNNSLLERGLVRVHLKNGGKVDGFVITSSSSLISIQSRSGVTTLQLAEVHKIDSRMSRETESAGKELGADS